MLAELNDLKRKFATYKSRAEMIGIIVGALLLVGIGINWYIQNGIDKRKDAEYQQALNTIQAFKNTIAEDKTTIGIIKQTAGDEHTARLLAEKQIKELNVKLKNVRSVVKTNFIVDIDTFSAPFAVHDTVWNEGDGIPIGSTFSYDDSLKYLSGTINESSVSIDSLILKPSSVTVTIASIKRGLFKKAEPSVIVNFSSPYISPINGQNIVVKDKRKPKRLAWLLSGVAIGVAGGILLIAN